MTTANEGSGAAVPVPKPKPPTPKSTAGSQSIVSAGPVPHMRTIELKNPSSFDPLAYWSEAESIARSIAGSDVYRVHVNFQKVRRDGTMDVTAGGNAHYHFIVIERARTGNKECVITVAIEMGPAGNPMAALSEASSCAQRRVKNPECTLQQIWDKATAMKAPPEGDAIFNLIASGTWQVSIYNPTRWSEAIDDDCKTNPP